MIEQKKIIILGSGAWGSTLAYLLEQNNYKYRIWSRSNGESLASFATDAEIIISAISMKGVSNISQQLQTIVKSTQTIIVTATKGLDPQSCQTPSHIWQETLPHNPIVVLSGPNLSAEIKSGLPAATVVASHNHQAAKLVQKIFM